jgi:hypothetical protein
VNSIIVLILTLGMVAAVLTAAWSLEYPLAGSKKYAVLVACGALLALDAFVMYRRYQADSVPGWGIPLWGLSGPAALLVTTIVRSGRS